MKGRATHATVQAAHYSDFDPDQWWKTRGGVRTEIVELQKLLLELRYTLGRFSGAFPTQGFPQPAQAASARRPPGGERWSARSPRRTCGS